MFAESFLPQNYQVWPNSNHQTELNLVITLCSTAIAQPLATVHQSKMVH
jgi:hypothetical protein